jgi:hypothetical protein
MICKWVDKELEGANIGDQRLDERFKHILTGLSNQPGLSLNRSFQTRKEVQAAYRFFSNGLVDEEKILTPHKNLTAKRASEHPIILSLSDTTSLNYTTRKKNKDSGYISSNNAQGFFLHASIAITPDRLHLGIVNQKFWAREKVKTEKLHRDYRSLSEKESYRWLEAYLDSCKLAEHCKDSQVVHVTDREGDLFEIYSEYHSRKKAGQRVADFVIRSNHNRVVLSGERITSYIKLKESKKIDNLNLKILKDRQFTDSKKTLKNYKITKKKSKALKAVNTKTKKISKNSFKPAKKVSTLLYKELENSKQLGIIEFEIIKRDTNQKRLVRQSVRAASVKVNSKDGDSESEVQINAIYLEEIDPPEGEEPVIWRLITSMPINTLEQILTVIKYYLCRWEIEVFFKTYKSGCKVEEKSLRNADRLYPLFCMLLIVAWRVNYLLHMSRIVPDISCEFFFEPSEWKAGYIAATRDRKYPSTPPTLQKMMSYIAKLGGHLGRKNDPHPGPTVIWKGICKLSNYADAWDLFGPEADTKTDFIVKKT